MANLPLRHMSLSEFENTKRPGYPRQFGGGGGQMMSKTTKSRHMSVAESQFPKVMKPKDFHQKSRHLSLRSVSDNDQVPQGGNLRKNSTNQALLKPIHVRSENKENEVHSVVENKKKISTSGLSAGKPESDRWRSVSKIPVFTGKRNVPEAKVVNKTEPSVKANNTETPKKEDKVETPVKEDKTENKFEIILPKVVLPENVVNIDIEDGMYEYSGDLIAYLRTLEPTTVLRENYLEGGSTLPSNRALVVDWIVQVCNYFNFCQETLFYAVSILDSVIEKRDIKGDKLQLVAVSSIWIASKLEEYFPADLSKLAYLTQNSYSIKQIVKMETVILSVLNFRLHLPCIQTMLKRYVMAALRSQDVRFVKTCQMIIESHIIHSSFPTVLPSLQVASGVFLANVLFHIQAQEEDVDLDLEVVWSPTLEYYTKYTIHQVVTNSLNILRTMLENEKYDGVRKKYLSQSKHKKLAQEAHLTRDNLELAQFLLKTSVVEENGEEKSESDEEQEKSEAKS